MLKKTYEKWLDRWETKLAFRSTDRVVRPFEWGLEYTSQWPIVERVARNGHSDLDWLRELNEVAIEASHDFYAHETPADFRFDGQYLRFTSPVETPHGPNNTVAAKWFPGKDPKGRAVIVLPHWNSTANQHEGLCSGIARFGPSTLRLSLPYHDSRMPPELHRADYAVSSNIARTIDATRQAVLDVRAAVDWLEHEGFTRIGIVGTSLGSCYAFLASAHEPRIRVNIFNHCSSYFADVVWTGLSTRHIKTSLEEQVDLESLRDAWACISPVAHMARYAEHSHKKSKFIYAAYDTTFLPHLSEQILDSVRGHGIEHEVVKLPCGHYTEGETPFKFLAGYHIVAPLIRWL